MGHPVGPEQFALRTDDLIAYWAAVRAGLGIGFVASYLLRNDPAAGAGAARSAAARRCRSGWWCTARSAAAAASARCTISWRANCRPSFEPRHPWPNPSRTSSTPAPCTAPGQHLQRVWPAFDRQAFEHRAAHGLDALEFKARAMQLADALEATLPADFADAADVLEASLAPPIPLDAQGEPAGLSDAQSEQGLSRLGGVVAWASSWRGGHGRCAARPALPARADAAFLGRVRDPPFHPAAPRDQRWTRSARWVDDPSAHVRRLVSEGSRPRLPWGLRLQALVADPSPTLPLLRALQDDPSAYVRRSVANHLNDIAKDHPDLVAGWVREHLADASAAAQRPAAPRQPQPRQAGPRAHAGGLGAGRSGLNGDAVLALSAPTRSGGRRHRAGRARCAPAAASRRRW